MRLEITRRSDLATRALLELARTGERTKASVLAEAVGTTPGFLSQAMTPLVARGWAGSEPGPTGGYTALVDPADLTVLEVIEAVEGPTDTGRCVLEDRACAGAGAATGLCRAAPAVVQRPRPAPGGAGEHPSVQPPGEGAGRVSGPIADVATRAPGRPTLRAVALPTEHGGWGLTLEPGLLGLLVAPSVAGACLALAAMVAFVARTPLKLALVDQRRGRTLPRTVLARRVAAIELLVLGLLVAIALATAGSPFWVPAALAAPLIAVESWFDVRSRSRRLVPELAGAVGVCSVAAMIVLADGDGARLAAGIWAILTARILTSIPHVRDQIARLHGRPVSVASGLAADGAALVVAAAAVALDDRLLAGAIAVGAVVVIQRLTARGEIPRAVVLGVRQMALGFGVVLVTAVGVLTGSN